MAMNSSGNYILNLDIESDGTLQFEFNSANVGPASSLALVADVWYHFEVEWEYVDSTSVGSCVVRIDGVEALDMGVMLVEYPGYGRSAGSPSEDSIRETMLLAFDWLGDQPEVDPTKIVVYGRSMGGGAACTLIPERKPAALILQSSFTGIQSFAID